MVRGPDLDQRVRRLTVVAGPELGLDLRNESSAGERFLEGSERVRGAVSRLEIDIGGQATAALEGARAKVARFIVAPASREVVFTKNATEALNLVAKAWGRANLRAGRRPRLPSSHRSWRIRPPIAGGC